MINTLCFLLFGLLVLFIKAEDFEGFDLDRIPEEPKDNTFYDSKILHLEEQRAKVKMYAHYLKQQLSESNKEGETSHKYEKVREGHQKLIKSLRDNKQRLEEDKESLKVLQGLVHTTKKALDAKEIEKQEIIDAKIASVDKRHDLSQRVEALTQTIRHGESFVKDLEVKEKEWTEKAKNELKKFQVYSYSPLQHSWKTDDRSETVSMLSRDGIVLLGGIVKGGDIDAKGKSIFTLEDEKQFTDRSHNILAIANNKAGVVEVDSDGRVSAISPSSASWFSLDGVSLLSPLAILKHLTPKEGWEDVKGDAPFGFTITRDGIVHLQGTLRLKEGTKSSIGKYNGIILGKLPVKARPLKWIALPTVSGNEFGRIDIDSDGSIIAIFPLKATSFSLSGISFPSTRASIQNVDKLENGWERYNSNHPAPGYLRTDDGVVYLTGTVKNGLVLPDKGVIFTLPEKLRPNMHKVFRALGNNDLFRIDITPNGKVIATEPRGVEKSWLSLNGIMFKSG